MHFHVLHTIIRTSPIWSGTIKISSIPNPKFSSNYYFSASNVTFTNNTASKDGGALFLKDSNYNSMLTNAYFEFNFAGNNGGALYYVSLNTGAMITQSTFIANGAGSGGIIE